MPRDESFSALIVGGGPVGLTMAHALSRVGIDFTLLEANGSFDEDLGAAIGLFPNTLRVMSQLRLCEKLQSIGEPLHYKVHQTYDGKVYDRVSYDSLIKENHGAVPLLCSRRELISTLYNALPENIVSSKIHTSKTVTSVTQTDTRATATCSDGTVYSASIVIGAEGVHSVVRRSIQASMRVSDNFDGDSFLAEYRLYWFTYPRVTEMDHCYEVHGKDLSTLMASNQDISFMFVYDRLPTPTREHVRYTTQDIDEAAKRAADLPIGTTGLKQSQVWDKRMKVGMTNAPEGILRKWFHGWLVLVGDAAHVVTPTAGLGLNAGIQDVVALTNELCKIRDGRQDLESGLQRYVDARWELANQIKQASAFETRRAGWKNYIYQFLDRWVLSIPWVATLLYNKLTAPKVAECLVFEELPGVKERFKGRVKWVHPMPSPVASGTASGWGLQDGSAAHTR
ncbi:hypothetical protein QBC35DRAFT_408425 [Podospora australis]|uniref:FAD-binding domain-containing protein n=1 Tax=Podospora australis TaxID=1536484 RepID=A0AAN7AJM6_9PEZI|nr:hypothetical protein QBC35DRAFT_408425 [Podospora australis]